MFAHDLHVSLAYASVVAMGALAVEGAGRAIRPRPPGRFASTSAAVALILVLMTAAGGLALWVRGDRPRENLHLVYAVLAFGLVPFADSMALRAAPRYRGVARLAGALVAIGVIIRLFATG